MKRLLLASAFLAVVITVSIIGLNLLEKTYDEVSEALTQGKDCVAIGDYSAAENYCKKAEDAYVKAEKYLSAFVNHSTLDEIGAELAQVKPFTEKGEEAEFYSHCEATLVSLKHLKNDMIISVKNLF